MLFVDQHPFLGQGNPWKLKEELFALANSNIEYFILGHGPVCQKEKIIEQIEYIDAIIALVQDNLDRAEELKAYDLPSKFHDYKGTCFSWNIQLTRFCYGIIRYGLGYLYYRTINIRFEKF